MYTVREFPNLTHYYRVSQSGRYTSRDSFRLVIRGPWRSTCYFPVDRHIQTSLLLSSHFMPLVFLLFLMMPILEIWVLIEVGSKIGGLNTIGLVILTAIIGTLMLRSQGLSMLARVRQQMAANQLPAAEIFEGLFMVVGGALLLTPGFLTDAVGFLCLIPVTRQLAARFLLARFVVRGYTSGVGAGPRPGAHSRSPRSAGDAIEGEYRREE